MCYSAASQPVRYSAMGQSRRTKGQHRHPDNGVIWRMMERGSDMEIRWNCHDIKAIITNHYIRKRSSHILCPVDSHIEYVVANTPQTNREKQSMFHIELKISVPDTIDHCVKVVIFDFAWTFGKWQNPICKADAMGFIVKFVYSYQAEMEQILNQRDSKGNCIRLKCTFGPRWESKEKSNSKVTSNVSNRETELILDIHFAASISLRPQSLAYRGVTSTVIWVDIKNKRYWNKWSQRTRFLHRNFQLRPQSLPQSPKSPSEWTQ